MNQEDNSNLETTDSIAYLDKLTNAPADDEEPTGEKPAQETAQPDVSQTVNEQTEPVSDVRRQEYRTGYRPVPEEKDKVSFWDQTITFRSMAIIGLLMLAIGLLSAGLYGKIKIGELNSRLAEKDGQIETLQEQIRTLEEENAELQGKADHAPNYSMPDFGDGEEFKDFMEQFGQFFGNWFDMPGEDGSSFLPADADHGYLGIRVEETNDGVRVVETLPNAKSDVLKKDDLILKVDGKEVKSVSEISDVLKKYKTGDTIEVIVKRGDEEETVKVELTDRYEEPKQDVHTSGGQDF